MSAATQTTPEIEAVKALVARDFNVTVDAIDSDDRTVPLPMVRHVAMAIVRKVTKASFPEIAAAFNKANHGTVMHACRATEDRASTSRGFRERIAALEAKAKGAVR